MKTPINRRQFLRNSAAAGSVFLSMPNLLTADKPRLQNIKSQSRKALYGQP